MFGIRTLLNHKPKIIAGFVIVMALSLPFVINQVLKQQDIRQRADSAPAISFNFSPTTRTVAVGETFEVSLIMNTSTNDIGSLEFVLKYPTNLVSVEDAAAGSALLITDKADTSGSYKFILLNPTNTPVSGESVKVITFKFKGKAAGTASVSLDPAIKATTTGTYVYVPLANASSITGSYTIGGTTVDDTKTCSSCLAGGARYLCNRKSNANDTSTSKYCSATSSDEDAASCVDCGTPSVTPTPGVVSSLTAPTNLKPTGTVNPGVTTLSWDASTKASGGYFIRVNDETGMENHTAGSEWSSDCANQKVNDTNIPTTGGICRIVSTTSFSYNFQTGHKYHWWVHSRDTAGNWGPSADANVTAKAANPPVSICSATKNRPEQCACTENTQCRSTVCTSSKCAPKPTSSVPSGNTGIKVSVSLPGIGKDLTNNDDNPTPLNTSRLAGVQVFNSSNNPVLASATNQSESENSLTNGSIANCNTTGWSVISAALTLASAGSGSSCNLTAVCSGPSICDSANAAVSFFQDIPVTQDMIGKEYTFSGKFGTVSGSAKGKLVVHQTKVVGGDIINNEFVTVDLTTDYKTLTKTVAKIDAAAKFLRFEFYLETPRTATIKADDMSLTIKGAGNGNSGATTSLVFNPATFKYEGLVDLGSSFTTGSYTVRVGFDNTLTKQVVGITSITAGNGANSVNTAPLITGDLNQDNTLGISDWTSMLACVRNEAGCSADVKALADLNESGEVDALDAHILQIGFTVREGD